jgi:hypothetical protein
LVPLTSRLQQNLLKGCSPSDSPIPGQYSAMAADTLTLAPGQDLFYGDQLFPIDYQEPDHQPAHCPSILYLFGRFTMPQKSSADTTLLVCSQYQEQIMATLSFDGSNLAAPPLLHNETRTVIGHTQYDLYDLVYIASNAPPNVMTWKYEFLTYNLVYGTDGVPAEELVGPENEQRFLDTVQHGYRKFLAQILSSATRVSANNATADAIGMTSIGTELQAQIIDEDRLRLVQHRTSAITL